MAEPTPGIYLLSPIIPDAERFAPQLAAACREGAIAAVLLRFAPADERTLINHVKTLVPLAQENGAAALVSVDGEADLAAIAVRGGADGVHARADPAVARHLRERLKDERIVGAGDIRSRHDAMEFGEAGVDYVMFGEPRPDGSLPPFEAVVERAAWWAEIFEIPCVAYAPSHEAVPRLAGAGVEFVVLGNAVWSHPGGPAAGIAATLTAARGTAEAAG